MAVGDRAPEVIFVPGFMQRGEAWTAVAERVAQRYRVSLLDHRASDLEGRLAEIEGAARPGSAVVGYSLGGRLALRAALLAPGRYAALVLVGASAGIEDESARDERRVADRALADWMEQVPIEEIVAYWEALPVFGGQSSALVSAQREGRLKHDPRRLAELLRSAGQGELAPLWEDLATFDRPVLAMAGANDPVYVEAARRIAATAPAGRAHVIAGAGHAAHLERPEKVAAALIAFLDGAVETSSSS